MATVTYESVGLILHLDPLFKRMSPGDFLRFAQANPQVRMEMNADGDLELMTPTGGDAGKQNSVLSGELYLWTKLSRTGYSFDSNTLFELPSGSVRSPDASWVARDRWEGLNREQRRGVVPLAPDFVAELRSPTDRLRPLQAKMEEYMDVGVRLGWLIDPESKTVWVYEPGKSPVQFDQLKSISGEPVLPGFVLDLGPVWD